MNRDPRLVEMDQRIAARQKAEQRKREQPTPHMWACFICRSPHYCSHREPELSTWVRALSQPARVA